MDEENFYRFMFWYCGDSKKTVEDAVNTWKKHFQYDEEKIKEYDDFHNEYDNLRNNRT